jgi:hypothetical protein
MNPVTMATQAAITAATISSMAGTAGSHAMTAATDIAASTFSEAPSGLFASCTQPAISGVWNHASTNMALASAAAQPDPYMFDAPEGTKSNSDATAGLIVIVALLVFGSTPIAVTAIRNFLNKMPAKAGEQGETPSAHTPTPHALAHHHRTGTSLRPPATTAEQHGHVKKGIS